MMTIGTTQAPHRRGHGPIEEEDLTSEDSPQASRTGDLPGGDDESGDVPADYLRKLEKAANKDAESELRGLE